MSKNHFIQLLQLQAPITDLTRTRNNCRVLGAGVAASLLWWKPAAAEQLVLLLDETMLVLVSLQLQAIAI